MSCLVRPSYFPGQLLTDQDLATQVRWTQEKLRLDRYIDGWGAVCGLVVRCHPTDRCKLLVEPGYAVDCCGRDIVVPEALTVDLAECIRQCEVDDPCADPTQQKKTEAGGKKADDYDEQIRAIDDQIRKLHNALEETEPYCKELEAKLRTPRLVRREEQEKLRQELEECERKLGELWEEIEDLREKRVELEEVACNGANGEPLYYYLVVNYNEERTEPVPVLVAQNGCRHTPECQPSRICETVSFCLIKAESKDISAKSEIDEWAGRLRDSCGGVLDALDALVERSGATSIENVPVRDFRDQLVRYLRRNPPSFDCDLADILCEIPVEKLNSELLLRFTVRILADCKCRFVLSDCHDCCCGTGVRLAKITVDAAAKGSSRQWKAVHIDNMPPARRTLRREWPPRVPGYVPLLDVYCLPPDEACVTLSGRGLNVVRRDAEHDARYRIPKRLKAIRRDLLEEGLFAECGATVAIESYRGRVIRVEVVEGRAPRPAPSPRPVPVPGLEKPTNCIEVVFRSTLDEDSVSAADFVVEGLAVASVRRHAQNHYVAVLTLDSVFKPSESPDVKVVPGTIRYETGRFATVREIRPCPEND